MRTRPDRLSTVTLPSGKVTVDEYGYLIDSSTWSPEFAAHVAAAEGISLTPLHLDVIAFMRDYQEAHGVAADARFVLNFLEQRGGLSKSEAKKQLFDLFPYGYVKQACKIAGMIQPRAWSTG